MMLHPVETSRVNGLREKRGANYSCRLTIVKKFVVVMMRWEASGSGVRSQKLKVEDPALRDPARGGSST
jgi:hypothetical protein